jgi:hypothetical protein
LGYDKQTALTLGKAVAGLNAQSKGKKLGIYEEKSEDEKKEDKPALSKVEGKKEKAVKPEFIELLGRVIPAVKTPKGLGRAQRRANPCRKCPKLSRQKFKETTTRKARKKLQRLYTKTAESKAYSSMKSSARKFQKAKGWGVKELIWTTSVRWQSRAIRQKWERMDRIYDDEEVFVTYAPRRAL